MIAVPAIVLGLFGSIIGSFLNVVAYRVPQKMSVVSPPSACPRCGSRIRGYDNVPVLSWLLLRGRCRVCRAGISVRYPLVELATAVFFAAVAVWWVLTRFVEATADGSAGAVVASILVLVAFLYLAAASVALALIDVASHRLPNSIVLPAYVVGAALLGTAGLLGADLEVLLRTVIGCAGLFLVYLILAFIAPGGMGLGDVKMAGVLGLFLGFLGWPELAVGALSAFVFGGIFGVVLLATRRAARKSGIPFGPWMLLGAWVGILAGAPLAGAYLALFGLA